MREMRLAPRSRDAASAIWRRHCAVHLVTPDCSPRGRRALLLRGQHRTARAAALLPGCDRARTRHGRLRDRGPGARQRLPGRLGGGGAAATRCTTEVIALPERQGKAANDSALLRRARGRFCLLLNEDSELEPGVTVALHAALDRDEQRRRGGRDARAPRRRAAALGVALPVRRHGAVPADGKRHAEGCCAPSGCTSIAPAAPASSSRSSAAYRATTQPSSSSESSLSSRQKRPRARCSSRLSLPPCPAARAARSPPSSRGGGWRPPPSRPGRRCRAPGPRFRSPTWRVRARSKSRQ